MHKLSDKICCWLDPNTIEPKAVNQLYNISKMPFIFNHIAVMPDCHLGKGATVGSVIATNNAIIPAAVGVDIGCGMIAVRTTFKAGDLPDNLHALRLGIERRIPLGAGGYNSKITTTASKRIGLLNDQAEAKSYDKFTRHWAHSLGSLGSGNHFIEICLDELDRVWVVLHSGSRGIGNLLAQKHIKIAQNMAKEMMIHLEDPDLAYLPQARPEFQDYVEDLLWAQKFALLSREEMMDRVLTELSYTMFGKDGHQQAMEVERINCHHNFTQMEHHMGKNVWVTRKGAIQASTGMRGVIPGSMGARTYVVTGLGNPMSFNSAPHGAGRRMSRTEAFKTFTQEDFDKVMEGVECSHSPKLIDEIPMAYKNIDEVMENSKDLVRIDHVLKQIVNIKGL